MITAAAAASRPCTVRPSGPNRARPRVRFHAATPVGGTGTSSVPSSAASSPAFSSPSRKPATSTGSPAISAACRAHWPTLAPSCSHRTISPPISGTATKSGERWLPSTYPSPSRTTVSAAYRLAAGAACCTSVTCQLRRSARIRPPPGVAGPRQRTVGMPGAAARARGPSASGRPARSPDRPRRQLADRSW